MVNQNILNVVKIIGAIALGVIYVGLLKHLMLLHISLFGDGHSVIQKMFTTGSAAVVSLLAIFLFNIFVLRQNHIFLGCCLSIVALLYFYQIHPPGHLLANVLRSLFHVNSAFAFFIFVVGPILVGFAINKKIRRVAS